MYPISEEDALPLICAKANFYNKRTGLCERPKYPLFCASCSLSFTLSEEPAVQSVVRFEAWVKLPSPLTDRREVILAYGCDGSPPATAELAISKQTLYFQAPGLELNATSAPASLDNSEAWLHLIAIVFPNRVDLF